MRRALILGIVGLTLAGAFGVGYRASRDSRATTPVVAPRTIDEVRDALSARYYRPVPDSVLRLGSVRKIISALGDPYTTYLDPRSYRLVRQETASRYSGIGVSVLPSHEGYVVVALRNGPAERAGVHVGDTIVSIGGVDAQHLTLSRAMSQILGPAGTPVDLQLLRGGKRLKLHVTRELISAPAVHARLISYAGKRWGVVQLSAFKTGSTVLLRREIVSLQRLGAAGLVLDLRDNPGGLLTQAVNVASLFIDRGVVARLKGEHEPAQTLRALPGVATQLPLVVLVDRYTASSAEIVAGALRDNHRATIVGERTFGKALVQAVDPLDNGAALELTIAQYWTPNGDDLSGVGLQPQIRAVDNPRTKQDEALAMALRVLARPAS
jgi:carboxyl-terminal processing protease